MCVNGWMEGLVSISIILCKLKNKSSVNVRMAGLITTIVIQCKLYEGHPTNRGTFLIT